MRSDAQQGEFLDLTNFGSGLRENNMAVKSMPFVIQGCRLIDGNGGKPIDYATVIIEGNRIKRIARGKSGNSQRGADH